MTDAFLTCLAAPALEEVRNQIKPIPFPKTLAPVVVAGGSNPADPLPKADVVVMTYTAAEGQALADVLSPGLELSKWTRYEHNYAGFAPDLTPRSPAREAKCLGQYALVDFGPKRALLYRSELHLATDSVALPLRRLMAQIIRETGCSLWIDTGTAGGIGPLVVEGDAVVATNLVFDCTGAFKNEVWSHRSFACPINGNGMNVTQVQSFMAVNAGLLRPQATRNPRVWLGSDVITCDSFLFDDVEDSFGLETYDNGHALVEEMDAAVLGLVAQDLGPAMPKYASVRSVSDPRMPKGPSIEAEKRAASKIYLKYGYASQVSTLCAVWALLTATK